MVSGMNQRTLGIGVCKVWCSMTRSEYWQVKSQFSVSCNSKLPCDFSKRLLRSPSPDNQLFPMAQLSGIVGEFALNSNFLFFCYQANSTPLSVVSFRKRSISKNDVSRRKLEKTILETCLFRLDATRIFSSHIRFFCSPKHLHQMLNFVFKSELSFMIGILEERLFRKSFSFQHCEGNVKCCSKLFFFWICTSNF